MRRALPLLVLVLAGCLGAPPAPGPGAAGALVFEPPVAMPGEQLSAEPNFAAGPEGKLWLIGVGSVVRDPNVARGEVSLWHSADFGATWELLRAPANQDASKQAPFCSCDTDVDHALDGTLYITDFWVTQAGNGFVVEASRDGGRTWEPGNFVTQTTPAGNDRQYIAAGLDPGEVYHAFAAGALGPFVAGQLPVPLPGLPVPGAAGGLQLWRSTDSGRTFTLVSAPFEGGNAFIAKLRVGPDGAVYYPWVELAPDATDAWTAPGTVVVAVSRDRGSSWERHEVAAIPNGVGGLWPLEVDVGPDGMVHAVWMERGAEAGSQLWYSRSGDGAATWSAPARTGWANGTAVLPWVAHAGPGRAVVAFYGNATAIVALNASEDTWWYAWALTVDGATSASSPPQQLSPWPVKVGTFCPQGASCPEDRELLDYPSVIWRDGWANVAFAVSTLDDGAGPPRTAGEEPRGGHSTAAKVWVARAALP